MTKLCLCFEVHIPIYFRNYRIFDIGKNSDYFDKKRIHEDVQRIVQRSFLPMNRLLLELIQNYKGLFNVNFFISGVTIDLLQKFAPEVIGSFRELADSGSVNFLSGPYHNSSKFLISSSEFERQVNDHANVCKDLLGVTVKGDKNEISSKRNVFLVNMIESFSDKSSINWPITSTKFVSALKENSQDEVVLYLDYGLFGDKILEKDGIFHFMRALPSNFFALTNGEFILASDISSSVYASDQINDFQNVLLKESAREFSDVKAMLKNLDGSEVILKDLDYMSSQEHVTRMSDDPYDYYVTYMNVLSDLKRRAREKKIESNELPKSGKVSGDELRDAIS